MKIIRDHNTAHKLTSGTSLAGHLEGFNYTQLVEKIGPPTFDRPSGDYKTQVEWIIMFDENVYTIYDWKTYDKKITTNHLTTWNIGSKVNANDFIIALENKLNS